MFEYLPSFSFVYAFSDYGLRTIETKIKNGSRISKERSVHYRVGVCLDFVFNRCTVLTIDRDQEADPSQQLFMWWGPSALETAQSSLAEKSDRTKIRRTISLGWTVRRKFQIMMGQQEDHACTRLPPLFMAYR